MGHPVETAGCTPIIARPRRDWLLIAGLFGGMLLLFVVFDGWMYLSVEAVQADMSGDSNSQVPSAGPSAAELNAMIAHYAALGSEHQQLLATPPVVSNPAK